MRMVHIFPLAVVCLLSMQAAAQENVAIKLTDAKVVILKRDGAPLETIADAFPRSVLTGNKLSTDQSVEVSISIKDQNDAAFKPQQVMLLLSQSSGSAAYVVGKAKRDGTHTLTINHGIVEKQVGKLGGTYEVMLLVGDPAAASGLTWKLGPINIEFDKEAPAAPALSVNSQRHVYTQPEIIHQHRAADKQPPAVISIVFAALALACLGGLLIALTSVVGVNFKAFPTGIAGLHALLFHGGIGAMLLLYLAFWTRLNLAQTVPIAGMIGAFVMATGYKALSAVADDRIDESRKKKE